MSELRQARWQEGNWAYVKAELARIRAALVRYRARSDSPSATSTNLAVDFDAESRAAASAGTSAAAGAESLAEGSAESSADAAERQRLDPQEMPAPPALGALGELFALSQFELDVVLLCAGFECSDFAAVSGQGTASFGLALAVLPGSHLSALSPAAALRRHHLVQLGPGTTLLHSALRLAERILYYLLGLPAMDEQLRGLLREVAATGPLFPAQRTVLERAQGLLELPPRGEPPVLCLCGPSPASRRELAVHLAQEYNLTLYTLRASDVPKDASGR